MSLHRMFMSLKLKDINIFFIIISGILYYLFEIYGNLPKISYKLQYYLYSYDFGFIKRGLIGSILGLFSDYYTENETYVHFYYFYRIIFSANKNNRSDRF